MVMIREIEDASVKIIFWYIAVLKERAYSKRSQGEVAIAMQRLTFVEDRAFLEEDVSIMETKAVLISRN